MLPINGVTIFLWKKSLLENDENTKENQVGISEIFFMVKWKLEIFEYGCILNASLGTGTWHWTW